MKINSRLKEVKKDELNTLSRLLDTGDFLLDAFNKLEVTEHELVSSEKSSDLIEKLEKALGSPLPDGSLQFLEAAIHLARKNTPQTKNSEKRADNSRIETLTDR